MSAYQVKCSSCGDWGDGSTNRCEHCGEILSKQRENVLNPEPKKIAAGKFYLPLIPIKPEDHWLLKGVKYPIRWIQAIFFAIASAFAWMVYWAAF